MSPYSPNVNSLLDTLMSQTCGIAILRVGGKEAKASELEVQRVKTIERLARQGMTPTEILAYVGEAEHTAQVLFDALSR